MAGILSYSNNTGANVLNQAGNMLNSAGQSYGSMTKATKSTTTQEEDSNVFGDLMPAIGAGVGFLIGGPKGMALGSTIGGSVGSAIGGKSAAGLGAVGAAAGGAISGMSGGTGTGASTAGLFSNTAASPITSGVTMANNGQTYNFANSLGAGVPTIGGIQYTR